MPYRNLLTSRRVAPLVLLLWALLGGAALAEETPDRQAAPLVTEAAPATAGSPGQPPAAEEVPPTAAAGPVDKAADTANSPAADTEAAVTEGALQGELPPLVAEPRIPAEMPAEQPTAQPAEPAAEPAPAATAEPPAATASDAKTAEPAAEPSAQTPSAPAEPATAETPPATAETPPATAETPTVEATPVTPEPPPVIGLTLLGHTVPPGSSTRLAWTPTEPTSSSVIAVPTPVLVINGNEPGPTLCLTAAIHGDELTGVEIVRRVMFGINPKQLRGAVIGVPIVNLQGFRRNSRYLPDRRDLNRYFPGNTHGSLAARVAHSFFNEVARHCDAIVDMHTGSFHRTNLPQVRADMNHAGVAELARNLGAIVVLQSRGNGGTLRRAAVEHGIPAVTLEAGEPMRLQEEQVAHGVQSVQTLLNGMNMYGRPSRWGKPEPIYYKSLWVRSDSGGILFSRVKLGDRVRNGELLGTVTDPITNARSELVSPVAGRVIGMALNQVVMPGFAAFHIGVQTTEEHAAEPVEGLPQGDAPAGSDGSMEEGGEADALPSTGSDTGSAGELPE